MNPGSKRIRMTIGTKLIGLIAILLVSSVVSLVWLSTRMFIEDNTALIQQMNADTASSIATQVRELFDSLTERTRVLGTALLQDYKTPEGRQRVIREFFAKDKDFLAVFLQARGKDNSGIETQKQALSPELEALNDAEGKRAIAEIAGTKDFSFDPVFQGEVQIATFKLADGSTALTFALPYIRNGPSFSHILTGIVRQRRIVNAFGENGLITSFLVDGHGRVLASSDSSRFSFGESARYLEIVKQLLDGKFNNGQTRYVDPQAKIPRLGAFHIVGFGGMGVVSDVPEAKAFAAAKRVEYRSILIALVILCLAFMAGYLYSGTITWPIRQLVAASQRIAKGDFAISLKPRSQDEVGQLSLAFNDMAKGLEERDRVKETFNKFHNKEIADKLLSGEVKLGGERLDATIFFSDVRGFTAMTETMKPEAVVEMLNEYMTRMVAIIRAHGGIVDKYVGDAIMALWGVPLKGTDDTARAVKACLEMRQELAKLNELRVSRGQHALKIGMGLNCGEVIAGNIGSDEKMEYTVIGDTVNTASRMESMTKEYGTDFLVPKVVHDRVKDRFVFEQCESVKVKGKSAALEVFKVKGYVDASGKEVMIETAYSSYAAEKSDKVVH